MPHHHSLLSKKRILEQLGKGIIIDPFDIKSLKGCSYDVRIGEYFWRRVSPSDSSTVFNPYDPEQVSAHFEGPLEAVPAKELDWYDPERFENIGPEDRIITFAPNELILGHTQEFIGGTRNSETGEYFTSEMKARSSIGRIGFEICRCAGWGDVGYCSRWTMEIKNDDPCPTFLIVGTRVAQIKFYQVNPISPVDMYGYDPERDHYQSGGNLEELKESWSPYDLLPKLTKT